MTWIIRCLSLLLWGLSSFNVHATAPTTEFSNRVVLTETQGEYSLGRHLLILEDPSTTLTFDDVRRPEYADKFVPSTKEVPGFGFSPSAFWVRVDLDRQSTREDIWLLEFGYSPMQWLEVYAQQKDGTVRKQRGGSAIPYAERPYPHHKHVFELILPAQQTTQLFVRIDGESSKNIPLRLYRADRFAQVSGNHLAMLTLYAGIILSLLCYNLFIYATLRDSVYLYYIAFLASSLLFVLSVNGVSQPLLVPDTPTLGVRLIPFSMGLFGFFGMLFTSRFIGSRTCLPRLHPLLLGCLLWSVFVAGSAWLASYHLSILNATAFSAVGAFLTLSIGCIAVLSGNRPARYFLLAWFMLLTGIALLSLRALGFLPSNPFTEYTMLWGSAAEAILLSVALAARMRTLKEESQHLQRQQQQLEAQQALNAAQEEALKHKQLLLDTVKKYSHRLESEVQARTAELVDTQQKLIASEKTAALGVFTAGMAHEINNPANFISVGAQNTAVQIRNFKQFITELLADDPDPNLVNAFKTHFSSLENSNATVLEGIRRIEHVVKQLQTNHSENNDGFKPTDVVATLESAWRLIQPSCKTTIALFADLEVRPSVSCVIAEVNQVFLALLNNASHAIEDAALVKGVDYQGQIRLYSELTQDTWRLTVTDNGIGIPADKIDKIFDPFFTTKAVGRGAGLGLSMARAVVKKHHGSLGVASTPGEGSTFTLTLPLVQPPP